MEHVVALVHRGGGRGIVRVAGHDLGGRDFDGLPESWRDVRLIVDLWRVGDPGAMLRAADVLDEIGGWLQATPRAVQAVRASHARAAMIARQASTTRAARRALALAHLPEVLAHEILAQPAAADILLARQPVRLNAKTATDLRDRVADAVVRMAPDWSVLDAGFSPAFEQSTDDAALRGVADTLRPGWRDGGRGPLPPGEVWDAMRDMPARLRVRQFEVLGLVNGYHRMSHTMDFLVAACHMTHAPARVVLAALAFQAVADDADRWVMVSQAQAALLAEDRGVFASALIEPYRDADAMREDMRASAPSVAPRWKVG